MAEKVVARLIAGLGMLPPTESAEAVL
jgi:hypothetical protein